MSYTCDPFVLLGYTFCSVDHNKAHIGALDSRLGAENTEFLYSVVNLALSAYSGGIYKCISAELVFKHCINRIARGSGNRRYYKAILTENIIYYRTFSGIRLSYDRNADRIVFFCLCIFRTKLCNTVKKVSRTASVYRRYRYRLTIDSKLVKLIVFHRKRANTVNLVYTKNERLTALHKHRCNIPVVCGNACRNIGHKYDNIGGINSRLCLSAHISEHHIVRFRLDTSGIDKRKLSAVPFDIVIYSVTGNAGRILYNRYPAARQLVEKCRFTDIRSADNCYYWFAHKPTSAFSICKMPADAVISPAPIL